MGLELVMIGMDDVKELIRSDPNMAAMVKWVQENVPAAFEVQIGEPDMRLAEGERVGAYSDLHVLRGLAIRLERDGAQGVSAATEEDLSAESEAYYTQPPAIVSRFRHLLDHSDAEGVYLPLPMDSPAFVSGEVSIAGAPRQPVAISIGSSEALLRELDELASVLGLPGDRGTLDDAALDAAVNAHRWPTAAYVWAVLHWFARESVAQRTIVQFC